MAQAEDLAFELEIGHGSGLEYPVTVHRSPVGEAQSTMRFPFSDRVLESRLQDLQAALRRARGRPRSEPPAEALGQALFDALFRGEVGSLYDECWRQAAEQGQVLRLRLRIQAPELVALPWEYLYDARLGEYLCLSHTSIVRYHEPPQSSQLSTVPPPLRILGMLAGSSERPAADAESARRCLEEATNHLQALELVKLEWVKGGTWRHLRQALGSDDWHVFYFVGDGGLEQQSGESYLVLEGEDGRAEPFSMARLGRLLASRESLQLVWLSAGAGPRDSERDRFYSMATGLLQRGIPAVLTMQQEMVRPAAEAFAEAFYAAVAATMSLDLAVAKARMATLTESSAAPAWGIPVLHTVSPDMHLFDRNTLAESACRRGDEALAADEFERSNTQYMLAAEMGAEAIDEAKVALAKSASRTVRDAEELLSWSEGNAESLADELLKVSESLEGLQQRLPDSQTIRVLSNRMEDKASSLRDLLWQDGQQMMRRRTIGLTLAGQHRQMEESVRLLEKATQLDQEENPALREDLDKAVRRLRYLENAQAQAKGEQGRRRRRITIVGAVVVIVLLLSCLAAVMAGAPGLFGLLEKPTSVVDVPAGQSTEPVASATDSGAITPNATAEPPPSPTTQPTLAPASTATGPLTSTDTPLPVDTASPAPSYTALPTLVPSSTAEPTVTQEQAATPEQLSTATPVAREAPPTPTAFLTSSPTVIPTAEIVYPAPRLLQPDDVVFLSQEGDARYLMRWTWDGALREDEWFDVRIWLPGSPHYGIAWTKRPEYLYDICLKGNGHFYWSVAVVRGQAGDWIGDLSPEASPRLFSSSRSDEWCIAHGRWVQGPGE